MRRRALLLIAVVVVAFGPVARSQRVTTLGGRIVFEGTRVTRPGGLTVVNGDGSHLRRVAAANTAGPLVVGKGVYAYTRLVGGVYVHAMVTDAGGTRELGLGYPHGFSPDGSVVVVEAPDASWELLDRVSGVVRGTFPASLRYLGWTAAGLLFLRAADTDLVVVQPDGSGEHLVPRQGVIYGWVSWSPDGAWIAYTVYNDATPGIALRMVRTDGSADHQISLVDSSAGSGAVWSPDGSRLAFMARDGDLAFASPAGGAVDDTGVAAAQTSAVLGSWSPDGRWFAFQLAKGASEASDTGVISAATHALSRTSVAGTPSWSPDGRTLLLITDTGADVIPASHLNSTPRVLARDIGTCTWLSDGRLIFYRYRETTEQIASVSPRGGSRLFIPGTEGDLEPAPSPDGTMVAFASRAPAQDTWWTIGVANADGSHRRVLAHSGANAPSPSWSPDGRFIAYAAYSAIEVVPVAGGSSRRVTAADLPWTVAWSPDGEWIAFGNAPDDSDYADVVLVHPDGIGRHTVVHGEAGENWGGVAWSPDGTTLAVARRSDNGGDPDGNADLYLLNLRTHTQREVGLYYADSSFSPDGKRIAVATEDGTMSILGLVKGAAGRELGAGARPEWAP